MSNFSSSRTYRTVLLVGTIVYHKNLGKGVTKWYDPKEPDRIEVQFEDEGVGLITVSPNLLSLDEWKVTPKNSA